jgi:ABC-type thiamin/hydroxymethylpyrimidine transport system permease subunit
VSRKSRSQEHPGVRDLMVIAVLSGIGGVMSTYVGYLGNLVNRMLGLPFGAGQFVAGLHVFWLLLAAGLVPRAGAATAAGVLKGTVEFLSGSTHGIAIILISVVQGLCIDAVFLIVRKHSLLTYVVAGAAAAASHVYVLQALFLVGIPWVFIVGISIPSLISGATLGGAFVWGFLALLHEIKPIRMKSSPARSTGGRSSRLVMAVSLLLALGFSGGAVYYFSVLYQPPWRSSQVTVRGLVHHPGTYPLTHFSDEETTIVAELKGEATHLPPRSYTGIPLSAIIARVEPFPQARLLRIAAGDGYSVDFELEAALQDQELLLVQERGQLRLVAGAYEGGYWVRGVTHLEVL